MCRIVSLLGLGFVLGISCLIGGQEEVQLRTTDGTDLYGTLVWPDTNTAVPLVIFIAGSGPVDRDGNIQTLRGRNDSFKMLAAALQKQGIASLRYDKRGIGKSRIPAFSEDSLRFEHYVSDVIAWARQMAKDPRFSALYLLGHSEGGLIALLAAQHITCHGVILLAPQPIRADQLIEKQIQHQSPLLLPLVRSILDSIRAGNFLDSIPPFLSALFRPSVQPYLHSWFAYDPKQEIQKLQLPILLICGTRDIQISCNDVQQLSLAHSKTQFVSIQGMNHVLKIVDSADPSIQLRSYQDPSFPLPDELWQHIVRFISRPE